MSLPDQAVSYSPAARPNPLAALRPIGHWLETHDPITLIMARTRTPLGLTLFVLVCAFPVLGHLISRLTRGRPWFNDYEAVLCAATAVADHRTPYSLNPACADMNPAPYVYAPQIAELLSPLTRLFSPEQMRLAYAFILLPLMAAAIGLIFTRPQGSGFRRLSLLSFTAMGGGAVASGNIGFVFLGLIVLAALWLDKSIWPFVIAVLIAALTKPVYLAFMLILLYREGPLKARLIHFAAASVTGLALVAGLWLNAGPLTQEWQSALKAITLTQQPGIGFFALTTAMGFSGAAIPALIAYAVYAPALVLGGLYLAHKGGLKGFERILLGLGIALLINPRLMDYDMLPLGPFMALLILRVRDDFGQALFARFAWAYTAPLMICLIANILEIDALHRAPFAVLAFVLTAIGVMTLYVRHDLMSRRLKAPLSGA